MVDVNARYLLSGDHAGALTLDLELKTKSLLPLC